MGRATWTLAEVEKVLRKVYTTKDAREKQLSGIVAEAQGTNSHSSSITLSNIVNGMQKANASIDKFLSVLLELDEL